jgi:hypothetical protein
MMFDVVVYLSSLPRISDRNRKVECLRAFAQGCRNLGLNVLEQERAQVVPAKLGVILGWVGQTIRGPHIQLRRNVINSQRVMSIDASCFKFADPNSMYLRYSLDGVYYNTNNYANLDSTADKWIRIQKDLNLSYQPWRRSGNHILICGQRDGGWSMKGTDMTAWVIESVREIRKTTNRPIVVRPHPKCPIDPELFQGMPMVSISHNATLAEDLQGAWAAVFFNSSSSVAAALAGIPVFAADPDCVAYKIATHNLSAIENPEMPVRESWLWNLAAAHWTDQESSQGLIWKKFVQYL